MGCVSDPPEASAPADTDAADGSTGDVAEGATYYRDALPIFARVCNGCHQPDAVAPFDLTDADVAAAWAEAIVTTTQARAMPPASIDASGACGTFADTPWLTDAELETLQQWADAGAPAGDPNDAPDDLGTSTSNLATVTHAVHMDAAYTPTPGGDDDYRCFVLDAPADEDLVVTAYRIQPGQPRIVHHVILFASTTPESDAQAIALDAEDETPGYPCFGAAGIDDFGFVAGWAPGTGATEFPAGTGIALEGGRKLIMQVHYFPDVEPLADQTFVELTMTETVLAEAQVLPMADLELSLPPGSDAVTTTVEIENEREAPVVLRGIYPHMHKLGRTLRVERLTPEPTCLIDVPRWDFDFQRFYFFAEPMVAMPGDRFRLTCNYDTSQRTEAVEWGEGTEDEMCLAGFYFTDA
ncbi:MAG: hypothetical protein AAF721_01435 [Myxococcota bacterium]